MYMNLLKILGRVFPVLEGKRLQLEITGDTSCTFEGDTFLIRHAIANLLQNAIDFSPASSKISANIFRGNDNYIGIEIKDMGTGIPVYALDKVYDRFTPLSGLIQAKKVQALV